MLPYRSPSLWLNNNDLRKLNMWNYNFHLGRLRASVVRWGGRNSSQAQFTKIRSNIQIGICRNNLKYFLFCQQQEIISLYKTAANWYTPIFLVFKSVGDIGPLLLREAGLLLVQDILRGFLCPTADFPCPASATGRPLLCCSSCDKHQGETKTVFQSPQRLQLKSNVL